MTGNVRQTPPEPTCGTLWVTSDNSPTRDGTGPQMAPEGTEDMKSIDNLREYVKDAPASSMGEMARAIVAGMADEIEREVDDMWHALAIDAKPMTDENMAADGWIRLPVDADGEPIHVGDVMENIVCPPVHREVTGVGVECFYGWDDGNGRYSQFDANCYRHHRAPTVEDVLAKFAERLDEIGSEDDCAGVDEQECRACIRRDIAAAYAEYAAKLRLAGEDE